MRNDPSRLFPPLWVERDEFLVQLEFHSVVVLDLQGHFVDPHVLAGEGDRSGVGSVAVIGEIALFFMLIGIFDLVDGLPEVGEINSVTEDLHVQGVGGAGDP